MDLCLLHSALGTLTPGNDSLTFQDSLLVIFKRPFRMPEVLTPVSHVQGQRPSLLSPNLGTC